jgi:CRISPR system Cascade subunit CasE
MYLSRLILNPCSNQARSELANPYEMHRTVMKAYAAGADRVLYRLEIHPHSGALTLLVQSQLCPDWGFLAAPEKSYLLPLSACPSGIVENPQVKTFDPELRAGQALAFRLRANPTVKKDRQDKKQGRRVALYREEDQLQWLARKLEAAGAELLSARTSNETKTGGVRFRQGARQELTYLSVQFDGVLRVRQAEQLRAAVVGGIGSGKGFGFGLLSLAPLQD